MTRMHVALPGLLAKVKVGVGLGERARGRAPAAGERAPVRAGAPWNAQDKG